MSVCNWCKTAFITAELCYIVQHVQRQQLSRIHTVSEQLMIYIVFIFITSLGGRSVLLNPQIGNGGTQKPSDLPRVLQGVCGRPEGKEAQVTWVPKPGTLLSSFKTSNPQPFSHSYTEVMNSKINIRKCQEWNSLWYLFFLFLIMVYITWLGFSKWSKSFGQLLPATHLAFRAWPLRRICIHLHKHMTPNQSCLHMATI